MTTLQESFTRVVDALRAQGRQSYDLDGCAYAYDLNNITLHCAIGCYLSKKALQCIADNSLEGSSVETLFNYPVIANELYIEGMTEPESKRYWHRMQYAHDVAADSYLGKWKESLVYQWGTIAEHYKIELGAGNFAEVA